MGENPHPCGLGNLDQPITMLPSVKYVLEAARSDFGLIDGFQAGAMDRAYDPNRDYTRLRPVILRLEAFWHEMIRTPLGSNKNVL
jgi:hypothetical protein